ncbi:DUF1080 domain-containing protein [Prolixibacteraceae bacterium JC049]|jgi:hypothetical protein|nr:DUF1080 domain-containing protein [Prolixibacteraceae bacterium JC049]
MKKIILLATLALAGQWAFGQKMKPQDTEDWSRVPEVVTPGKRTNAPSDAVMLYGGRKDAAKWEHDNGDALKWKAKRALTVKKGTGYIRTKQGFGDVQLHIEWRAPRKVVGEGQGRGNSGVFFMGGLYEVQILDSYNNKTYSNGQASSVYKQFVPLANACKKPGKWQAYDIIFQAPRFNEDKTLKSPAYITVIHNGVLVQNHVELKGPTLYIGKPEYKYHADKLPIKLQDHGNPVSFRNIWVRELNLD